MIGFLLWFIIILLLLIHAGGVVGWIRAPRVIPRIRKDTDCNEGEEWKSVPRFPDLKDDVYRVKTVSVIIPARNEEEVIEECVTSYCTQDFPYLEVVVVDDRSEDRTSNILTRLALKYKNLNVIRGGVHPKGWTGKNFAAHQGYKAAKGNYLLFVDADTIAEPCLVSKAIEIVDKENIDLLTAGTRPVFQGFWDRAVIPVIGQFFFLLFRKVNDPDSEAAGANGPFLFFKREAYESLGGHEAIKKEMLEDQVFGETAKRNGYNVKLVAAHELISQHFYKNLGELWEGWVKILYYNIARDKKIFRNLLTPINILMVFFLPWFFLGTGLVMTIAGIGNPWSFRFLIYGGIQCLLSSLAQELMRRYIGVEKFHYPFIQPVSAVLLTLIWVDAATRFITGGKATWKGRSFSRSGPGS